MAATILALTACATRPSPPSTEFPTPYVYPPAPGEIAHPLRIVRAAPVPVERIGARTAIVALPGVPADAKVVAAAGNDAYFAPASGLIAVDLRRGRVRWIAGRVLAGYAAAA